MIKEELNRVLNSYLTEKKIFYNDTSRPRELSKFISKEVIENRLPEYLQIEAKISKRSYKITGRISSGNMSDVPWIGVFDNDITDSAQHGYYIVYLFKSDMTGLYLSLNQGWTQYQDLYGTKNAKYKIRENAIKAKQLLRGVEGFDFGDIKLLGKRDLAKGYEIGNICSKYYSEGNLPTDEVLVDDLRNLIGVYRELKGLVGNSILNIEHNLSEEEFQSKIQIGSKKRLPEGPIPRKTRKSDTPNSSYPRDPEISYKAIESANFQCENNPAHHTFISKDTKNQFVEAHHLVPMGYQDDFKVSIDVPENIISLCPNCHRAFHSSIEQMKKDLLMKFYQSRERKMKDRGIMITELELLKYYL